MAKKVAHRDGEKGNIMMDGDALFPEGFHPVAQHRRRDAALAEPTVLTRSQEGVVVKYYFIDFGISTQFFGERELVLGSQGRDDTVPELSKPEPYDPFALDVYVAGNLFREYLQIKLGLGCLRRLVTKMTDEQAARRLSAEKALEEFRDLRTALPGRIVRRRLVNVSDGWMYRIHYMVLDRADRLFKYRR